MKGLFWRCSLLGGERAVINLQEIIVAKERANGIGVWVSGVAEPLYVEASIDEFIKVLGWATYQEPQVN